MPMCCLCCGRSSSIFLGKLLYLLVMVDWTASLYEKLPAQQVFLHILLLSTIIGGYANTDLFNPTKDKYYAVILMRMDARAYTLVNYIYGLLKTMIGFLPFIILFGRDRSVPLWLCVALPFAIVGMKLCFSGGILWLDEKKGWHYNENTLSKFQWGAMGLLLVAAYGLPMLGIALPAFLSALLFLACIPLGVVGLWKIVTFKDYRAVNKELLSGLTNQMDTPTQVVKKANEKKISTDVTITSSRRGFEYLNELFIKRHRKILWNSTKKISFVCLCIVAGSAGAPVSEAGDNVQCQPNGHDLAAVFCVHHVCHQSGYQLYPSSVYELRSQPADLFLL